MNSGFIMAMVYSGLVGMSTLSGQVVNEAGEPIPEARVFAEPGLTGALLETQTAADGRFHFDDISPGDLGLFAVAPEARSGAPGARSDAPGARSGAPGARSGAPG